MNKDMNPTEYANSDENIPDRITEDERRPYRCKINNTIVWDIYDHRNGDYSFISYDSEGNPRRYITQSIHQSVPYYLSDGDSLNIGYKDIIEYLNTHKK